MLTKQKLELVSTMKTRMMREQRASWWWKKTKMLSKQKLELVSLTKTRMIIIIIIIIINVVFQVPTP